MISTHILDTSLGHPAAGVTVELERLEAGDRWAGIAREKSNADGRIAFACPAEAGTYRILFRIEEYFRAQKLTPFFTLAPVVFRVSDPGRKYHIPLLLSPYGYSTYRGS